MRKILVVLFIVYSFVESNAQIGLAYGYSSTAAGIGKIFPVFKQEVNTKPWNNVIVRNGIFEFQFAQGAFEYGIPGQEGYQSDKGSLLNIGLVLPLHQFTLIQRKKYWNSIHAVPLIGVQYSTQSMGRFAGISAGQVGINIAPSLSIQFPLGMIDIKLNNGFYFGKDKVKNVMERYRGRNYLFTPSVSIQLDGMFERMGGEVVSSGEFHTTWRSLESEEVEYDEYSNFRLKTTRRNYKYNFSSGVATRKLQRAFWYLSGSYNKGSSNLLLGYDDKEKAARLIPEGSGFAFSFGGRWRDFMIDLSVERNSGFYAYRNPTLIEELKNVASEYPLVEGSFKAQEIRGKIGFDVVSAVGHIVAKRQVAKLKNIGWPWVKFMRFNVGLSGGMGLPSKTTLLTENGQELLNEFFTTHPEIDRNDQTDILENDFAWTIGLFMNWEMGPLSIGFDWHGHNDFGWRTGVGIQYLIPLNSFKEQ